MTSTFVVSLHPLFSTGYRLNFELLPVSCQVTTFLPPSKLVVP
ncbi:hypothetical protein COLO4_34374 [Corchorus olitorius]|uniref:Uncharacterized protein n=1 Tax=Corchorus olitorius TaxID=93759 RepID=A0A1R3GL60_9ROSI|nr:hypothetical protein COLO4_34374 [Corchorus olitorius]